MAIPTAWPARIRWFMAEFLVVLTGVFLALALDAWWTERQKASRERETLERLHEESEAIVRHFGDMIAFHDSLNRGHEAAVAALQPSARSEPVLDVFRQGVFFAFTYPAVNPPRTVYDEVTQSGVFGALSSVAVRSAISEYYGRLDWIQSSLAFFRQTAQPGIELTMQLPLAYDSASDQRMRVLATPAQLRGDRVMQNALIFGLRNQLAFQRLRRRVHQSAVTMCQTLAREVAEQCEPAPASPAR